MKVVNTRLNRGACTVKRRIRVSNIIWEGGLGPQEMDIEVSLNTYFIKRNALDGIIYETNQATMGKETDADAWPASYSWRFLS